MRSFEELNKFEKDRNWKRKENELRTQFLITAKLTLI